MFRLHTDDLDPGQLQSRLESLLDQGFKRVPDSRYSPPPAFSQSALRQRLRRWAWARRMHGGLKAWKLSGWSLPWLVRHTPVIGPVAWHVWGKLTLRGFRQHALTELDKLTVTQQQLQAGLEEMEASHGRAQERTRQREEGLAQEARLLHEGLAQEVRLLHEGLTQEVRLLDERLAQEARLLHEGLERATEDIGSLNRRSSTVVQSDSTLFPAWYLALENQYRGNVEDIETRLSRYLPHLKCAQIGQADWPVLDLGCGRGEWLRLLGRHQLAAIGVDSNAAMFAEARRQGLRVVESDLIAYLRATDAESIGAVTAFQVVEHIDQDTLLTLFQQALRVLRPGGVLLLETPNPENLQVAAYSFWLDPTHVRPLPAPLLAHSATYFGFIDICIERSNAWSDTMRLEDTSDAARHLEKLLFCGQDYALIARKPYAEEAAPTLAGN